MAGLVVILLAVIASAAAQDTVTGAFEGTISDNQTGVALKGATVEIVNQQTGISISLKTDYRGRFYQGLLIPGTYRIRVSNTGYQTREVIQRLKITYTGEVVPVPVALDPAPAVPPPVTAPTPAPAVTDTDIRASIITVDARRSGSFSDEEISSFPLGGVTFARTFDELALLLPGVAPPPQTLGSVAGPGVGPGVGSAGQFSVNGLRSRGNNFTGDGSDNNDEDIGVRRQGFVALIPQPIESVQEYQVITLLAPAQFGRNIGGQVNAVSKSGGNATHGVLFGAFNSSQLNARNPFDTTFGNGSSQLRSASGQPVLLNNAPMLVTNQSGGKDSFTFVDGGFVLGGPFPKGLFYFVSAEGQTVNATEEHSFAVPTLDQRGVFRSGATGLVRDPFTGTAVATVPTSRNGGAVFNLFPFPNNPNGIYGVNTFTQSLDADQRGVIASGRLDKNFNYHHKPQSLTLRYNFSQDRRIIPVTGGALFSSLQPRVRAQNLSFYSNNTVKDTGTLIFNQLRLSYGRTRLAFDEVRNRDFLVPSASLPNEPFLLNAPALLNITQPAAAGVPNTGPVRFISPLPTGNPNRFLTTVEPELGPLGQVAIAGFSPLGVDVLNFPQSRVNNTYQIADDVSVKTAHHSFVFGIDLRRSELNSNLPRNARPVATFNSAPRLILTNGTLRFPNSNDPNPIIRGEDLAALGAASNFFFTLNRTGGDDAHINLRYYQLNLFAQDSWRVNRHFSLSYGLRYEYNTPVAETQQLIERTFNDPALALAPGLNQFINGRTKIFDPDRNNFEPRLGLVYTPRPAANGRLFVLRAGYGLFYDQILGAVASQSRNVFPSFITLNFGGVAASASDNILVFFNPGNTSFNNIPLQVPGTLNRFNPALPLADFFNSINNLFPRALGATLPLRTLNTPLAHHYTVGVEQQLSKDLIISASYVGTTGRNLLRFTTPNLGPGITVAPTSMTSFNVPDGGLNLPTPIFLGRALNPPRPLNGIGAVDQIETTARSQYHSLQVQVRGRWRRAGQFQLAYTLSKANDEVSDVFDLAGAFVLPQNSLTFGGEYGPANFDVRHRLTYAVDFDLTEFGKKNSALHWLTKDLHFSSTGRYHSGQPFTVNSSIDVNLDGNLTDRLNNLNGLVVTGSRSRPLALTTTDTLTMLAPFGQDGAIGRNIFRSGSVLELDASVSKMFFVTRSQRLLLRLDAYNFMNRANFGVPVRILEAPSFGQAVNTVTPPRRFQAGIKYLF